MSLDYIIHVGPYVKCDVGMDKHQREIRTCSNQDCKLYKREIWDSQTKFCAECGSEIKPRQIEFDDFAVPADDVRIAIKERLYLAPGDYIHAWMRQHKCHIWLPNIQWLPTRQPTFNPVHNAVEPCDISSKMIEDELIVFRTFFEPELMHLRTVYGENFVHVPWGIVQLVW